MAIRDWNIRSRSHNCSKCAVRFEKGDVCRSAVLPFSAPLVSEIFAEKLAEEEAAIAAGQAVKAHPEFVRLDFCKKCWEEVSSGQEWISAWQSIYEPPPETASDPVKKADPESLLRSLLEGDDIQNNLAPIYLLAVMLERKRIVVDRGGKRAPDGTLVHIYEHRRSGDILLIPDPDLRPEQIPGTQQRISILLGLETVKPAESPAEATPPASGPTENS